MNRNLIALIIVLFAITGTMSAQTDNSESKPSPYDLISKYYQEDFDPFRKKSWYLGLAFSLQDQSLENTQRLLDKVVEGDRFNYNIEVKGGYFIGDYVMAGLTFEYQFDKFEGTTLREGDTIASQSIKRRFTAVPVLKAYFPLTKNERLSFFTEIGAGFGGGNTLIRDTKNIDEVSKTYANEFVFSLGFTPGITFFAIENFAFEVGLNVIGYTLTQTKTTFNDTEVASETRHNVNLQINLLTLKLGLAYYFG